MQTTLNGAPRKTLSDQLDRLDAILDGLAEAIPAVVADTVRQAVRDGVRAAVAEVLRRQELRQTITQAAAPAVTPSAPASAVAKVPSSLASRTWAVTRWLGRRLADLGQQSSQAVTAAFTAVRSTAAVGWARLQSVLPSLATLTSAAAAVGLMAVPLID